MTVRQIVEFSSNIGTITIAQRLGEGRLASWIDRFGFGKGTGIDFPGESAGFALPLEQWSGSTIGTVPIGHGIAVTPMQMARAYSAIANGGVLVRPHLVDRVDGRDVGAGKGRRVVSRAVAGQMLSMLRGVVVEGTGTEAAIPGYTVAGKTGTAAKIEPSGRYSTSRYVASFVGLVPASKPKLVVMVMVDEPRGRYYGGVVAAPAFREIARFNLQYLEIPQDAPGPAGSEPASAEFRAAKTLKAAASRPLRSSLTYRGPTSLLRRGPRRPDPGTRAERGGRGPPGRDRRSRVRHPARLRGRALLLRRRRARGRPRPRVGGDRARRGGARRRADRSTSTCRSSSSRRRARRWPSRPTSSSASRRRSSSSRA